MMNECTDAVSREAVIEWLKDKDIIKLKSQEENARKELMFLSSVTHKSGKWIITTSSVAGRHYQCSECKYIHTFTNFEYCPKCGCRMY